MGIIILAWSLILHQLGTNKKDLINGLKWEQANLTGVLAENLAQILEQKQAVELFAAKWFSKGDEKPLNDIAEFLQGQRAFTRIVLYDSLGKPFYQSSPGIQPRKNKIDILAFLDRFENDETNLIIYRPNDTQQVSWQIPLLFPLKIREELKGAIYLELDIGYFLNLFHHIDMGRTGKICIIDDKGEELVRFENGGLALSNSFSIPALKEPFAGNSGIKIFPYPGLGSYHQTYQRVRNYPVFITIGQAFKDFLSSYEIQRNRLLVMLTFLTAVCLSGLWFLIRLIDRKHVYLGVLADLNKKNKQLIQKLETEYQASTHAASFDALTDLYNRRLFISLARKNLLLAKRNSLNYAVLFIDLDRFKQINDTLGHHVGDLLLKAVADRLKACTRESDIIGRFGGDEFVIMLSEMSTIKRISQIAEKIIASISNPFEDLDGHRVITSPSIGIAVYPGDGENIDTLLLNADAAMYKSKNLGRSRYSFFDDSMNTPSVNSLDLEQRMSSAITRGEFELHFQPKIRIRDYRVIGLEALVRWNHPDHQLIFPSDFIKIAEKKGLINDLGFWILERVCTQMGLWKSQGLDPMPVSVNVSPFELNGTGYAHSFLSTLNRYGLCPELLEVEVTQNAFLKDRAIAYDNLNLLASNGVKISLDDFGKRNCALQHIESVPITTVKIDSSFVQGIRNSHQDNSFVASTIILARKYGMNVLAKGVETHDQLVSLKVAECDLVQGYYFSRPVTEKKIKEFIIQPLRRVQS